MRLQPMFFRPFINFVVVIDIAQQQASIRAIHDQANIAANPYRAEIFVPRPIKLVKAEARISWGQLQIEGRCFDGFLFIASKTAETDDESVGDEEAYQVCAFRWTAATTALFPSRIAVISALNLLCLLSKT